LYAKLYVASSASDTVLRRVVAPVMRDALASGAIRRWFFVRFSDPAPHLRVRAYGPADALTARVLPRLTRALRRSLAEGTVWRLQLDTYEPEVERYGGLEAMSLAERVFALDTEAIVALLERQPDRVERSCLAALGIDRLLSAAGLSPDEKIALTRSSRDAAAIALGLDGSAARRERGEVFRAKRSALADLLASGSSWPELVTRDAGVARAVAGLRRLERACRLTAPLSRVLADFVHMHANRVFESEQRAGELLALDLLHRHYRGVQSAGSR
jgi:thiopeptide-type bacteriocin biosynthesis protein